MTAGGSPPIFSIVTVTLNSERYLAETIDSVLTQDYPHRELIVIDGGSTDGTLDIIRSYGGNLRSISEPDRGIADAMNKGIGLARGEVVAHLHSDDRYLPGALSTVAKLFSEHPKAMWVCGSGEYIDEEGRRIKIAPFRSYSYDRLKRHNFLFHPAVFLRKKVFNEAGHFDASLRYAMDYDLWLRVGRCFEPVQTKLPLASFRQHGGSLSTVEGLSALEEEYAVRQRQVGRSLKALLRYRLVRGAKRLGLL